MIDFACVSSTTPTWSNEPRWCTPGIAATEAEQVVNSSNKSESDVDRGPFEYGGSKNLQPAGGLEFEMPGSDGDEEAEEEVQGSLRDDDEDEDEEPETGAFPVAESSPAKTSCPAGESAKTSEVEATHADDVRTTSPAVLDAMRSTSMLKKKWDLVKKEITRWDANYKQSGSYNPDKGDYCLSSASKSKRKDKGMLCLWLLLSAENLVDAVARNLADEVAAEVGMPWATPA
eukprot:jgi/Tetstr1/461388/TSEL_006500.t1